MGVNDHLVTAAPRLGVRRQGEGGIVPDAHQADVVYEGLKILGSLDAMDRAGRDDAFGDDRGGGG